MATAAFITRIGNIQPPKNLSLLSSSSSVDASWTAAPGATGYNYRFNVNGGAYSFPPSYTTGTTATILTKGGDTICVQVQSTNLWMTSIYCAPVCILTPI